MACESWGLGDDTTRQKMSVMASAAAWGLGQWESMEEYVRSIPKHTMEGSFYQALLHIHQKEFDDAQKVRSEAILKIRSSIFDIFCTPKCQNQTKNTTKQHLLYSLFTGIVRENKLRSFN